ncbi:MAG: thioredoxin-like domain-containing protein [Planctomycetota bacterium]
MPSIQHHPCLIPAHPPVAAIFAALLVLNVSSTAMCQQATTVPGVEARTDEATRPGLAQQPPQNPFPEAIQVPDGILEGGTAWLNTDQPIDLKDLRGKIVVVDFWTYCCINCMHVLPDLRFLEEKYGNQLVVIGVHSAKFENEKVSESIRDAILRYEINHPVVNDSEMAIWKKFGTQAWPTLALIDPEGKYCGSQSGEGHRELLDNVIGKLVVYHRAKGTLNEKPLTFTSEASKAQPTPLRYPGKVFADAAGQRLFVTDSNHNRIVVSSFEGEVQQLIGSGRSGMKDGSFDTAEFNRPQGTALVGSVLYVADTENHVIRAVDLESKMVSTVAGTGRQGPPGVQLAGPCLDTPLNSPWSIAAVEDTLYIAMAGPHQIWSHKLGSGVIGLFAGTGREDVTNGPLLQSAFAQPSELVADANGKYLYVVDSEGSAVRKVATNANGRVTTVAGTSELPRGQSLFAFGDVDAVGRKARFQHPLGVAISGETLFIADSYNHKIKQINLKTDAVTSWFGTKAAGAAASTPSTDLPADILGEPGGLSIVDGTLFVADTNNHRIISIDIATKSPAVIDFKGLTPPTFSAATSTLETADMIQLDPQKVNVSDQLTFNVALTIPDGNKLNTLAPVTWEISAEGTQAVIPADVLGSRDEATVGDQNIARFSVPLSKMPGDASLILKMTFSYCGTEENALCYFATATWKIPVTATSEGGTSEIQLTFPKPDRDTANP